MFQRVGAAAYKENLDNTIALCAALGNPQGKFKSIHIAGTNGKGSTSHMIASILQSAGYKTGLYTSPHLKSFTERIRINGDPVSEQFVVDFVNRIRPEIDKIKPSFFEITVAMAFEYFVQENIDIAVVEVGLGGRLDSTNIITPELSVITNIGWDHKEILGDTLQKIASEKAGIIKHKVPVVVSERQEDVKDVFIEKARTTGSSLTFASDYIKAEVFTDHSKRKYSVVGQYFNVTEVSLPLQGRYQEKNVKGVMAACDILHEKGFHITNENITDGLTKTIEQTHLKGRWQKLNDTPLTICDTGHNLDGVKEIIAQIRELSYDKLHIVWGMVKDKDINDILELLPKEASYYFCQAKIPRALEAGELAQKATEAGLRGVVVADVNEAMRTALRAAKMQDLVFIGGSTFVVAELEML